MAPRVRTRLRLSLAPRLPTRLASKLLHPTALGPALAPCCNVPFLFIQRLSLTTSRPFPNPPAPRESQPPAAVPHPLSPSIRICCASCRHIGVTFVLSLSLTKPAASLSPLLPLASLLGLFRRPHLGPFSHFLPLLLLVITLPPWRSCANTPIPTLTTSVSHTLPTRLLPTHTTTTRKATAPHLPTSPTILALSLATLTIILPRLLWSAPARSPSRQFRRFLVACATGTSNQVRLRSRSSFGLGNGF